MMDLPEELLLEICEYLQPPRYEDEAALHADYDAHRAAHHSANSTSTTLVATSSTIPRSSER